MDFKQRLKRPPLTTAEAQQLAENTLTRLQAAEQNLLRLESVLNYIYPQVTPEQQAEMERLLQAKPPEAPHV
jgi:hypothetical protein